MISSRLLTNSEKIATKIDLCQVTNLVILYIGRQLKYGEYNMKKLLLLGTTSAIAIAALGVNAKAEESSFNSFFDKESWQIRLRSITVAPDESSTISNGSKANAKPDTVPEIDFTYFINNNWATELILGSSRHDMYAGSTDLGHVWILPPTLTLQYHFTPEETFRPYVGAGVNYTFFYNAKKAPGLDRVAYKDSIGFALQAGADYMLDENWGVNFDVKKIYLDTDVNVNNGAITGHVDLDPWIVGFGITYKF